MSQFKCNSCEGIYDDILPDKLLYFHACAPVQVDEKVFAEKADKRDENNKVKAEGKGRTKLK